MNIQSMQDSASIDARILIRPLNNLYFTYLGSKSNKIRCNEHMITSILLMSVLKSSSNTIVTYLVVLICVSSSLI